MGAAEVQSAAPWLLRPFAEEDADALYYMLGISYTRSRTGKRAGVMRAGGSTDSEGKQAPPSQGDVDRQRAFLEAHRPIWSWLMQHADITLACDPEQPRIIWGWLIASGAEVIHAVGCKRSFCERQGGQPPLAVDLVGDLLGPRLHTFQVCTLELPQMRAAAGGCIGLDRPAKWSLDPTWLLTRMVGR